MKKTVFAYTEPKGTFPAMVNVTQNEDGTATIIVRNRRASLPSEMNMPKADFSAMCAALAGIEVAGAKPVAKKPTTKK